MDRTTIDSVKPTFVLLPALLGIPGVLTAAPPDDEALLGMIRQRDRLERVTASPVDMDARTAHLCRAPVAPRPEGPHKGARLQLFISPDAADSLYDPWAGFPVGTLILKEKLPKEPGAGPELITGMLKREAGFWPELGDWEFFTTDGKVSSLTSRGKLETCAECHRDYKDRGFVTKLVTIPEPGAAAPPQQTSSGKVVLHAVRAAVKEGSRLQYEPPQNKNTLGFWTDPADTASWQFELHSPGLFSIALTQGCGKGSGGADVELAFEALDPPSDIRPEPLRFTVEDTGHFQNFRERQLGSRDLSTAKRWKLTVKPLSKPGVAVMDLQRIVLEPVRK
ncbi:MAG: hypothetical protein RLZZ179_854 [Verrucomicrobiota bacterium]|jgi:hypothetical protein